MPSPDSDHADPRRVALVDAWRFHVSDDTEPCNRLLGRYREKHRRYHTVDHLAAVVGHVLDLADHEQPPDLGSVVAAALYHDAIYEPASPAAANERASARLARRDLERLGWGGERIEHVATMIEGTSTHLDPPDIDTAVLFDADLAVLGADPERYAEYVEQVRSEYRHVADDDWRTGRAEVLRSLLDREAIYATEKGRERWEQAARSNITTEVSALGRR